MPQHLNPPSQPYTQSYLPQQSFPPPPMMIPSHQPQQFLPLIPPSSSNSLSNPPQLPQPPSMPTQPNPNPNNKPPQLFYHNEMASIPSYPINTIELDRLQLSFAKALKGTTITKVHDEPEEEMEKEPLFPN